MTRCLLCCVTLAACSQPSAPAMQPACMAPDYLNCPTLPPSTMLLINHAAVVVELEAARRDGSEIALSDSPAPGQQVCQLFGRWIPDSTIMLLGLTATGTGWTSTLVGSFNAR